MPGKSIDTQMKRVSYSLKIKVWYTDEKGVKIPEKSIDTQIEREEHKNPWKKNQ